MEILKDAIQHKASRACLSFDGYAAGDGLLRRVCGTLRKSFEKLNADVSAVTIWYPEAREGPPTAKRGESRSDIFCFIITTGEPRWIDVRWSGRRSYCRGRRRS